MGIKEILSLKPNLKKKSRTSMNIRVKKIIRDILESLLSLLSLMGS
jgi:hypothetical protein